MSTTDQDQDSAVTPQPKRLPLKIFWSSLGVICAGGLGAIMQSFGHAILVLVADGAALAGIAGAAMAVAGRVVGQRRQGAPMFDGLAPHTRAHVLGWIRAAVAANAVFAMAIVISPALWPVWTMLAIVIFALEIAIASYLEYDINHIRPAAPTPEEREAERAEADAEIAQLQRPAEIRAFQQILALCDLDWLQVDDHVSLLDKDGTRFGVKFRTRVPAAQLLSAKGNSKKKGDTEIGSAHSAVIAIAAREVLGMQIKRSWVSVNDGEYAGDYEVVINTEDIMARLYAYEEPDLPEVASIWDPAPLGWTREAERFYLALCQHGSLIGGTSGGKTSFINLILAYITRCATHDQHGNPRKGGALAWVGGTHKVYETLGPWIEPYLGTGIAPPIDWVAGGAQETANMLASAMAVTDARHNRDHDERTGVEPAIFCVVDEFWFFVEVKNLFARYRGVLKTPSDLAAMIIRAGFSVGVFIILASQRGTNDNWGDNGGDVNANMGYSICLRTRDPQEIGRQLGDFDLHTPQHRGEAWIDPGGEGGMNTNVKGEYIQESSKQKKKLHSGPTDRDVAWARRHITQILDDYAADAAGEHYANRARTAEDMKARLRTPQSANAGGGGSEGDAPDLSTDAEAEALAILNGDTGSDQTPELPAEHTVQHGSAAEAGGTLEDKIVQVLDNAPDGEPMDTATIYNALPAGWATSLPSLRNALSNAATAGRIAKAGRGQYLSKDRQPAESGV